MFEGLGGGLGAGALGLGLVGDIFGAYSQMQAQQRQRELYKRLQDPRYIQGQAQQYYNADVANFNQTIPQWMRQNVNPQLATQGIDPSGGAGQSIYAQALAQQQQQMWQNALARAQGGLQSAGGYAGQPSGQLGGTAGALNSLMLLHALQGRTAQGGSTQSSPYGDTSQLSAMWGQDNPAMMQFDPNYNYGVKAPVVQSVSPLTATSEFASL